MLTILFLPFTMTVEMLYQSTGHRVGAAMLSSARSGLFFIPALLILTELRGLSGIQEAQPLAYVVAFPLSLLFAIRFLKQIPHDDEATGKRT